MVVSVSAANWRACGTSTGWSSRRCRVRSGSGRAAADAPRISLAAVGSATARVLTDLAGRPVDLLPSVQRAAALADLLIERCRGVRSRVFVAQADRAEPTLVDRLLTAGHDVTACVAYRTVLLRPDPSTVTDADALVLASGSSAQAWSRRSGPSDPAGRRGHRPDDVGGGRPNLGLKVTSVATEQFTRGTPGRTRTLSLIRRTDRGRRDRSPADTAPLGSRACTTENVRPATDPERTFSRRQRPRRLRRTGGDA